MTKAAVRAMDTVTAFCAEAVKQKVDRFVVAGGSKRGWTTWTTAAVDDRVIAIAPFVIDVLNGERSLEHHFRSYGLWAPANQDYVDMKIMDWAGKPQNRALMKIEDPYSYRDRLTMPKLIVNATGDQYFLPDSSRFYFDGLQGEKHLRYVPNAKHDLNGSDALMTLAAFYEEIVSGKPRPRYGGRFEKDGSMREQEIAMRRALGASRGRLMRQLLTESVVLAACGGMIGVLLSSWGLQLLKLLEPPSKIIPVRLDVPLNARVLVYTAGLSAVVGLVVGLAPAWRSCRWQISAALRSGHPDTGASHPHRARFQRALVAAQLALSFVLLMAAGLCLKSLQSVLRMDPGFEFSRGLAATLNLSYGNYDEAAGRAFFAWALEQVRQLPGVEAASLAVLPPLVYAKTQEKVEVPGYQPQLGESLLVENNMVSPDYFATLGIPILEGRPIEELDRKEREGVMVVNETMARKFWGTQSPLGRAVKVNGNSVRRPRPRPAHRP